ncbi:hypothetical protein N8987_04610 [Crocinitomix sp.]|nr:hypothetical protein [Crocinitomix sp.]
MNKKVIFLLPLLTLLIYSCEKAPEACMELGATITTVGTAIEFKSCSENALSIEWYIEGPEDAPENDLGWSDISFTHAFSMVGSYTVTLHAYEKFSFMGERSTVEETIVVN